MKHNSQLLINARTVFADETRDGVAVLIEDGRIAALDPVSSRGAQIVDLQGTLLIPGLIDLHCDAIEKEVEPRPGVHFPVRFACQQVDRRNASAGITTVYHSLSFANHELGVRNNAFARELCEAVAAENARSLVDNRIHARYEITDPTAPQHIAHLMQSGCAQLISFMDHTPGQGQFKNLEAYRDFLMRTYDKTEADFSVMLADKQAASAEGMQRVRMLAEQARHLGIAIASHDDDKPEKVDLLKSLGATISEFPINMETAAHARASGLYTLFGAPNVLRGRSQSGSMKALDAVVAGVADCLCGDYSPAALLPAALKLTELAGLSLSQAIALVSHHPAEAAGLHDRGRIAVGLRADLVAVRPDAEWPVVHGVWSRGRPVFQTASMTALPGAEDLAETRSVQHA